MIPRERVVPGKAEPPAAVTQLGCQPDVNECTVEGASEAAIGAHHPRGVRVVPDQVAAPLALPHVQALTAEPVPLVATDHAEETPGLHEAKPPPVRWLVSMASPGPPPSFEGWRRIISVDARR